MCIRDSVRREGYEFAVSKAEVLYHYDENGKKLEPMEIAVIDVPEEFTGAVIEKLSQRKGEHQNMTAANGGYARLEFSIPSRGLIGYRGEFMTDTKGNGILNTLFDGYGPYKGCLLYTSMQKMGFIPESHNDMIFSIICEELGLFGAVCLILVFVTLIFRMLLIALNTEDLFGSLVVIGFMTHIAIQVFINIAVVTNTIPPTGIPLPFISYGGTSIFVVMI